MASLYGHTFRINIGPLWGESPVPHKGPVMRNFDISLLSPWNAVEQICTRPVKWDTWTFMWYEHNDPNFQAPGLPDDVHPWMTANVSIIYCCWYSVHWSPAQCWWPLHPIERCDIMGHDVAWLSLLGPVLLRRYDAVGRLLANGSAAFIESCAAIGWKDCDSVRSLQ